MTASPSGRGADVRTEHLWYIGKTKMLRGGCCVATGDARRRVVVTGLGAVTPIGCDVPTFWANLTAGTSGAATIDTFDASPFSTRFAASVRDFEPERYFDRKELRHVDRFAQFAVAATREALADAGFAVTPDNARRVGVMIGSGIGGIRTLLDNHEQLIARGPRRVSPYFIPMMMANMAAGLVSIQIGATGPNGCPVAACATGNSAIGAAAELIQDGAADVMIAGGAEAAINELSLAGFGAMRALSTRNDEPQRASRPFDADRDGFVMAEGAGILLLESREHALERGARIRAEMSGIGFSADAYHLTAPDPIGWGAYRAMEAALENAGLAPEEVDYINAHATGTDLGDRAETAAIRNLFGAHAFRLAVSANKSMIGHLFGAAGGVEAVATIKTIEEGLMPPTVNLDRPDPECDLDYVPNAARRREVRTALSNGFGFGGHNAVLVFRRHEG